MSIEGVCIRLAIRHYRLLAYWRWHLLGRRLDDNTVYLRGSRHLHLPRRRVPVLNDTLYHIPHTCYFLLCELDRWPAGTFLCSGQPDWTKGDATLMPRTSSLSLADYTLPPTISPCFFHAAGQLQDLEGPSTGMPIRDCHAGLH